MCSFQHNSVNFSVFCNTIYRSFSLRIDHFMRIVICITVTILSSKIDNHFILIVIDTHMLLFILANESKPNGKRSPHLLCMNNHTAFLWLQSENLKAFDAERSVFWMCYCLFMFARYPYKAIRSIQLLINQILVERILYILSLSLSLSVFILIYDMAVGRQLKLSINGYGLLDQICKIEIIFAETQSMQNTFEYSCTNSRIVSPNCEMIRRREATTACVSVCARNNNRYLRYLHGKRCDPTVAGEQWNCNMKRKGE